MWQVPYCSISVVLLVAGKGHRSRGVQLPGGRNHLPDGRREDIVTCYVGKLGASKLTRDRTGQ